MTAPTPTPRLTLWQVLPAFALHQAEFLALRVVTWLAGAALPAPPPLTAAQRSLAFDRIRALVPLVPTPQPLSWWVRAQRHLRALAAVTLDAPAMARRRLAAEDRDFPPQIEAALGDFPVYYRRNFHHQTDGYLSVQSGRRYDLQFELVFSGIGHRVRRTAASHLTRFLHPGRAYRMLECGSGTGDLGAIVRGLYPESDLLCTDPSLPYLEVLREKYPSLQTRREPTFMEDLSFAEDRSLDLVFAGFVFHELPPEVAARALDEAFRVLEPGGMLLLLDSSQATDGEENAFALDRFAEEFYEPWFADYRPRSLQADVAEHGFELLHAELVYFSKVVVARRPS